MFESFERVVQCRKGHMFQTIWVPLMSFKAVRLGWHRFQFCPVGRHWTMVERVDADALPRETLARLAHDIRIP